MIKCIDQLYQKSYCPISKDINIGDFNLKIYRENNLSKDDLLKFITNLNYSLTLDENIENLYDDFDKIKQQKVYEILHFYY